MNWFKGCALALCLAAPLPLAAMPVAPSTTAEASAPTVLVAEEKDASSEADKRAKAVDCSKQADAKKLHGEARKKFRSSCKRGK